MKSLKLRRDLLLLLRGMDGYCADMMDRVPSAKGPETHDFLQDVDVIRAAIMHTQAIIRQKLSGTHRDLNEAAFTAIKQQLRQHLDIIIQHCKTAKDQAAAFNAEREIIETTRAARYFVNLIENNLSYDYLTSPPPMHAINHNAPPISRLLTHTGELLLVSADALFQQLHQPFTHAGHTLDHAATTHAAQQLLAEHCYDLILIDTQLGYKDSLALLQNIRHWYAITELGVIMLHTAANNEHIIQEIQLGANDHLTQPLNIPLLSALVRKQLAAKSVSEQSGVVNMFIRSTLASYLTYEIADQLLDTPQGLSMQGEKRKVTILFSDLREFTAMSEKLDANTVVQSLNTYLSRMIDVVSEFGGIINEVMGDGLLILFGVPVEQRNDAERAVACAIAMQEAMASVNDLNHQKNLPALEMGIGINTGEVAAGNIGSELRTKYSVVGQHVNLAARVESQTMGGQILITENTLQEIVPRCHINSCSKIKAKGIEQPITLYDIGGIEGDYTAMLPQQDDKLFQCTHPLSISFKLILGKKITHQVMSGKITAVSTSGTKAQVITHSVPTIMSDILFHLGTSTVHIHAKVTKASEQSFDMTMSEISDRTTLCTLLGSC